MKLENIDWTGIISLGVLGIFLIGLVGFKIGELVYS